MARYMETADELRKEVESFVKIFIEGEPLTQQVGEEQVPVDPQDRRNVAAQRLGHIVNLAIRACPRGVQHTVRLNIVREAVGRYCKVTMTEETDERTGRSYHKIHIQPRS
jgi:aminoglycoside phosphotransferase